MNDRKTAQAFLWTHFLKAPFWGMYALLLFILSKDLGATPFELTIFIALKPVVSLFSPYWSALVHQRPDRLRSNVMLATLIGHLPFFFIPLFATPWYIIGASALFLMMRRGVIPAWMEILKRNLPESYRHKTFSYGSILSYIGGAILPIFFGFWMDHNPASWKLIFPLTSFCSLAATLLLLLIPTHKTPEKKPTFDLKVALIRPWKNAIHLWKTRPDFNQFQLGFMLGGSGLMVMQPALPSFFLSELGLSYTTLAIALTTCKGIGFALTSRLWAKWMERISIFRFSSYVTILAALFPIALLFAKFNLPWIYAAYLIYGIMQAGSELSWHLSGPLFARLEDSSSYSSVNVIAVGLRGLIAPLCGALLCTQLSPIFVLLFGGFLCLLSSLQLNYAHRSYPQMQKE